MKVNWRQITAAKNSYAVLSAACEAPGFSLRIVDAPCDDITCYSLNSLNEPFYREEIAAATCITIVGGPHATATYRSVTQYADYVVVGEGEYTLPRLFADLEAGGSGQIPGVASWGFYEPADTCVRLDAYPAFSAIQGYVEISRGCPFGCGYCQTPQIFGHCMRHRSIDEIARYANRYQQSRFVSPNAFAYGSDGLHPDFDAVERLLKRLRHQIYFGTFPGEVRPEFICDRSLSLVTDYCANTRIHLGAQSGSNAVLERIGRGHTIEDAMAAVDLCGDYGIIPIVDFIVGFPFETDDEQRATGDAIRQVVRFGKVHLHRFIPLPGTPLAGTPARPLLPEIERMGGKLALSGKLTGAWNEPERRFLRRRLK